MINKKGNVFFNIGIGLFIYICGVLILPFLADDITTTRANLGCENIAALTNGTKLVCITISGLAPYYIWFFISIAIGYIVGSLRN